MRAWKLRIVVIARLAVLAVAGCAAGSSGATAAGDPAAGGYVDGPRAGATVEDISFLGLARPTEQPDVAELRLSDFYNPTGIGAFPPGSPYGTGRPRPTALLISSAATWCEPARQEAASVLPPALARYRPMGAEFVTVLVQAASSEPADEADLLTWVERYRPEHPVAVRPSRDLSAIVGEVAFPASILIRTRDMKIVRTAVGMADEETWDALERVLADEPFAFDAASPR